LAEATYRGTVYPWQCDHVGHMNIMWYVGKFDEANWNFLARPGLTPTRCRAPGPPGAQVGAVRAGDSRAGGNAPLRRIRACVSRA
jgi:hypothetical protein